MKNHKIGVYTFSVGPRAKVSITNTPQVLVKGSIIVNGNQNFNFGHYEKWVLHSPCWSYLGQKCQLRTLHKFGSSVRLLLTEIEISTSAIMKNQNILFYTVPVGPRAKVLITDPPQVWVKGSIIVNGNRNFNFGFCTVGPRAKMSITDPPQV